MQFLPAFNQTFFVTLPFLTPVRCIHGGFVWNHPNGDLLFLQGPFSAFLVGSVTYLNRMNQEWWMLPVFGMVVGAVTNWVALKVGLLSFFHEWRLLSTWL